MKQTNNAIKFLMAQYRAIFKNANIAMLAAIAASALAAGQAQAAKSFVNDTVKADGTNVTVNVDGTGTDQNAYDKIALTDGVASDKAFVITVSSGAANNTIKGSVGLANSTIKVAGADTTNAKLDIGTGANNPTNLTLKELSVAEQGALIVAGTDADNKTSVIASTINFGDGQTAANSTINIKNFATVSAEGDGDEAGKITINQATVDIATGGTLKGKKVVLTDGAVTNAGTLSGGTIDIAAGTLTNTGTLTAGTLNLAGGKLVATKAVTAKDLTVSDGTLTATEAVTASNELNITGGKVDATKAVSGKTIKVTGGEVDFAAGGNGALGDASTEQITISGGTVGATTAAGTIKGTTIKFEKGEIKATNALTIDGGFAATGGTITVADNETLTFKGKASIADEVTVTLVGNTAHTLKVVGTNAENGGKLSVSSNKFKELTNSTNHGTISLSGAAGSTAELNFTDSKIDLGPTASTGLGILTAGGKLGTSVTIADKTTIAKISGVEGVFTAANDLDAEDKKLTLAFETLTVGSGDTVTLKSGAGLEVSKLLTVGSGATKATLKVVKGGVTLNGSGSVAAKTINLEGSDEADAKLDVTKGAWEVKNLSLTKGKAEVAKDGQLTVTGTLLGKNNSTMTVNGVLSTVGSGELTFKDAAASALTVNGKFELDADDILTKENKLNGDALKAAALAGKGTIKIDNQTTALTEKQFTDLQSGFSNFKGLFEVNVDIQDHDTLTTTNAFGNLKTDKYDKKSLNISGGESISKNYSVGNVVVNAKEDLKLAAGGSLSLNNPQAQNGSGNFVSMKSGEALVVGNVQFTDADNTLTLAGTGKIGSITADAANKGVVDIGNTDKAGHVTVVKGNSIGTQANPISDVNVVKGSLNVESGSIFANNFAMDAGTSVQVVGDITTKLLTVDGGLLSAKTLKLEDTAKDNTIAGGANVTLDSLTMGNGQALLIGEAGQGKELGSNAVVYTKSLKMGNTTSSIFVDPNYGTGASLFATENIGDNGSTVTGKVGIGSNSAFGVGFESMAAFKDVVGDYLTNKGGFDDAEGKVKNALVLNKGITVADGNGITVDATLAKADYESKVVDNTVTLGAGAALVLTDKAFGEGKSGAAITFASTSAGKIAANPNSEVVLVGDFDANDNALKLAVKKNVTVDADGLAGITLKYAGGLLEGKYDRNTGGFNLEFKPEKADAIYDGISRPVADAIVAKLKGELKEKSAAGYGLFANLIAAENYKAIDAAAHAATYAGAQQAAVAAVTTMADAMFGRVGAVGVEAASISATGSQANGGVWLTPMYKSVDSDGFNAEGASYGADVDLSGVAFGTDTVNGNMRFGAVFNIGSGDAEGKGNGNGLKDEFDYYGFGIYSAMGFGNFALVGDASMTVISHEVEGLGLRGKADTTAVTMGVTGQYTVATPVVDVTPHLGARFIRLNTDSYDLISANAVEGTTDFDVQNVFSVPLGVTLSKGFVTGGWTLAPSADLTIAFNTGDTEAKSNTFIAGKNIGLNTEVLDEVQYGVTLGLGAQYGAFGTSFGINYTGSSNTDSFGVNAQARYMF